MALPNFPLNRGRRHWNDWNAQLVDRNAEYWPIWTNLGPIWGGGGGWKGIQVVEVGGAYLHTHIARPNGESTCESPWVGRLGANWWFGRLSFTLRIKNASFHIFSIVARCSGCDCGIRMTTITVLELKFRILAAYGSWWKPICAFLAFYASHGQMDAILESAVKKNLQFFFYRAFWGCILVVLYFWPPLLTDINSRTFHSYFVLRKKAMTS